MLTAKCTLRPKLICINPGLNLHLINLLLILLMLSTSLIILILRLLLILVTNPINLPSPVIGAIKGVGKVHLHQAYKRCIVSVISTQTIQSHGLTCNGIALVTQGL